MDRGCVIIHLFCFLRLDESSVLIPSIFDLKEFFFKALEGLEFSKEMNVNVTILLGEYVEQNILLKK